MSNKTSVLLPRNAYMHVCVVDLHVHAVGIYISVNIIHCVESLSRLSAYQWLQDKDCSGMVLIGSAGNIILGVMFSLRSKRLVT